MSVHAEWKYEFMRIWCPRYTRGARSRTCEDSDPLDRQFLACNSAGESHQHKDTVELPGMSDGNNLRECSSNLAHQVWMSTFFAPVWCLGHVDVLVALEGAELDNQQPRMRVENANIISENFCPLGALPYGS
eukprot:3118763-Pyramimonas_sp.AAC.1